MNEKMLEVEVKVRVNHKQIKEKLEELKATFIKEVQQEDTYFEHPCWNFKDRDEALRVREEGNIFFLTFKGPKLDKKIKVRKELQLQVESEIFELLKEIGFSELKKVRKRRKLYQWKNLKVCLDKVEGLGDFLEIEGKSWKDKSIIRELVKKLNIKEESLSTISYLELLLLHSSS